ncbi:MAG: LapA family protein [Bacteroidales bacterium]
MKKTFSIITIIVLLTVIVIVTVQNSKEVLFQFFGWETSTSLILLLFSSFFIGIIVGLLISLFPSKKKKDTPKDKTTEL